MMEIVTIQIKSSQYGESAMAEEYNGAFSIVAAQTGKDGKTYSRWAFPQTKDRKPAKKAIPVKVSIGGSLDEAISTLKQILSSLEQAKRLNGGASQPPKHDEGGYDGYEPPGEDDIPF
jgi:hypothetical protein